LQTGFNETFGTGISKTFGGVFRPNSQSTKIFKGEEMVGSNKNEESLYDFIRWEECFDDLKSEVNTIADCIYPLGTQARGDASGTQVTSLTDAVMGLTSAIMQLSATVHDDLSEIRQAIEDLDR
jgi:hypothetical protein